MNGSNIQNHSLMLSEYFHNIQYIDITISSNSIPMEIHIDESATTMSHGEFKIEVYNPEN